MSEIDPQKYLVRDPQGNVYGPADAATLRDWVGQGRIVAGMHIAPRETREWVEVSVHPALADLFSGPVAGAAAQQTSAEAARVTTVKVQTWQSPTSGPVQQTPGPATFGTMAYETPAPKRRSVISRISMITGIASPCLLVAGCIPVCGVCVFLPLAVLSGLTAIVLGVIGIATAGPERSSAKVEGIVGIGGGAITFVLLLGLLFIGFMAPVAAPPVAPRPAPAPLAPVPGPIQVEPGRGR